MHVVIIGGGIIGAVDQVLMLAHTQALALPDLVMQRDQREWPGAALFAFLSGQSGGFARAVSLLEWCVKLQMSARPDAARQARVRDQPAGLRMAIASQCLGRRDGPEKHLMCERVDGPICQPQRCIQRGNPGLVDHIINGLHLCHIRAIIARGSKKASAIPKLSHIDHLVLTVADIPATTRFYEQVLGMQPRPFQAADGSARMALGFGAQKINLHQAGREFEPKARAPVPGSADLCFLSNTPLQEWQDHLRALGTEIEDGPVARSGATGPIMSIYLRDPDGNLIEISIASDEIPETSRMTL